MSLYDDFDKHRTSDKVAGWSSGIKLLQSQLQLKKAATTQVNSNKQRTCRCNDNLKLVTCHRILVIFYNKILI